MSDQPNAANFLQLHKRKVLTAIRSRGNVAITGATAMTRQTEIETGDFVTIIEGDNVGWSGILDNTFDRNGVTMFAVIDETDAETFYYATAIKLLKKAN